MRASALYRSTARPGLGREGRELLQRRSVAQTVRIPAELAYERSDLELEIERCGEELRIRPAGRPIIGALEALAAFSPSFLAEGREQDEQQDRETL